MVFALQVLLQQAMPSFWLATPQSIPQVAGEKPRHKAYHKSLEKSGNEHDGVQTHRALDNVVLHEVGVMVEVGSCSVSSEERDANGMTALLRAASVI